MKRKTELEKKLQKVIDQFPKHVADKKKKAKARKKFLKETFSEMVRIIKKMQS